MDKYILIAGPTEGPGPTKWTLFFGPNSLEDATTVAPHWAEEWGRVEIRPIGFIEEMWLDGKPGALVEWKS